MRLAKYGEAFTFRAPIPKAGSTDLAASADWTPAAGDVKVSKDGGNVANITSLPTAVGGTGSVTWNWILSATEMQAAQIIIQVVDSATKAVEDQFFEIHTYGNASAQHAFDLDTATQSVSLAAGAITDASLAGNMETVFETDFATNYNTTRNAWVTNTQDFVGTSAADPFNGTVVSASVTGNVGGNVSGNVTGSVGSNLELGPTEVNAQVTDVLKTDTVSEMSQGAPPLAPTMEQILNYLYREWIRNKVVIDTNTLDQKQIFADDSSTVLYEKGLANASNVTTISEATTGA